MFSKRKTRPQPLVSTPSTVSSGALAAAVTIGQGQKKKQEGSLLNRRHSSITPKVRTSTAAATGGSAFDNFDGEGSPQDNYHVVAKPKMVKRYIPTAQGVKVIEVPEESFDSQLQRSNSLRVGMNIQRLGSLQKNNGGFRTNSMRTGSMQSRNSSAATGSRSGSLRGQKPPTTRRVSVDGSKAGYAQFSQVSPPQSNYQAPHARQSVDFSPSSPRARSHQRSESATSIENELSTIDLEIKKQKLLQQQLDLKKQEYLSLKSQNNKNLSELNQYQQVVNTTIDEGEEQEKEILPEPSFHDNDDFHKLDDKLGDIAQDPYHDSVDYKDIIANKNLQQTDNQPIDSSTYDSSLPDSSLDPLVNPHDKSIEPVNIPLDEDRLTTKVDELHDMTVISDFHDETFDNNGFNVDDYRTDEYKPRDILPQENHITEPYNSGSTLVPSQEQQSSTSSNYGSLKEGLHNQDGTLNHNSSNAEMGIIKQYIDENNTDVGGFEDAENELGERSQLAQSLRPQFTQVPQIIENKDETTFESSEQTNDGLSDSLRAPNVLSAGSSVSSIRSNESAGYPNPPRPLKSAMKNSQSNLNLIPAKEKKVENKNAAHDVYLSLATSENTKLNSKLSANNLTDPYSQQGFGQYHQNNQYQANPKRMSQSLRQQPPQQPQYQQQQYQQQGHHSLSKKSLRPQSMQQNDLQERKAMSNRNLRSSVYVAPIASHPALQPGYQSPSKLKAKELYAKANARPKSQFAPVQRKSSFTKGLDESAPNQSSDNTQKAQQPSSHNGGFGGFHKNQQHQQQQQQQQRIPPQHPEQQQRNPKMLSLRNRPQSTQPISSNHHEQHSSSNGGFKSRFADSDDEDGFTPSQPQIMSFNPPQANNKPTNSVPPVTTLRNNKTASSEPPKEKKKFGKLRKLFGKSK